MSVRSLGVLVFALFSSAMLGLAAGALWMAAALYMRQPLPWLALPVGAALGLAIRSTVHRPGRLAALLAATATALATIYVHLLIAGVQIAGNMGIGLVDALRTAGIRMLWQLARFAVTPPDMVWAALAALLAAWLAWRAPRRH
ncbi:MAG: hypothetical protein OQK79_12000 [Rhodanobacter sp.]|jgi:vitamin B12 transport system permease protein|nr:hypothetical protein [Rhodanobacter sp.]